MDFNMPKCEYVHLKDESEYYNIIKQILSARINV